MPRPEPGSTPDDAQAAAIAASATRLLAKCEERARLLSAVLVAVDQSKRVQAVIAASESAEAAGLVLMNELGLDSVQARAVLDLQYRRLAGRERAQLADEYQALIAQQSEYESIVNSPERQRELVGTEEGAEILRRGSF